MRENLKKLIEKSINIRYRLPTEDLEKISISTNYDLCLESNNDQDIVQIIYNSIIDYCLNESEIDITKMDSDQLFAIENRLRFSYEQSEETQIKYGFYGETLLNVLLNYFCSTKKIIAKGYFYSPIEDSEPKGYDCFHFFENIDKRLELWFGEAKMYQKLSKAIENVMNNINRSLQKKYFNKNVSTLLGRINDIDNSSISEKAKTLYELFRAEKINLWEVIKKNNIGVVYPIFIAYEYLSEEYKENIKSSIEIIEKEIDKHSIDNEISASILFIILPLQEVKEIKKEVIKWILQKKSIS